MADEVVPGAVSDEAARGKAVGDLGREVERLRAAIRTHRDERGDSRCWQDDDALYAVLPEGATAKADTALPPKGEFLESCARWCAQFWEQRQRPEEKATDGGALPASGMTIAQLEAEVERLAAERKLLLDLLGRVEDAPDKDWFRDYFTAIRRPMILTEEGWEPPEAAEEYRVDDPEWEPLEVLSFDDAPAAGDGLDTREVDTRCGSVPS
jgi:hypothetical protein